MISSSSISAPTHRLNMEVDLQSLFGLHVTWWAQLFSLAETPQLPPSPRIWTRKTRALLVSKDRRHLFLTPCSYLRFSNLWRVGGSMASPAREWSLWPRLSCILTLQSLDRISLSDLSSNFGYCQRYTEVTRDPPSLKCCGRNILTLHRETLTQYITFKRGGEVESLYSCTL